MLQDSRVDPTASYVVHATIDMLSVNVVLGGGDSSYVALLPSGFAILPDGPIKGQRRSGGSLITVALQVLVVTCTIDKINNTLITKSS
ncbi:hypothetical protein BUALT_Bualt18G0014400 [Buddleja alternifolia]|uniref:HD-Zip IV C-terminal domain-containing protein n=1 Tax=Buddleja alternifolia TaxID=168488 RepID=A0AAV6W2S5_9LAMI|nr:hypothetical protein BUALT_Bualt18G0014400 [Buddleja alternifolia]